MDATNFTTILNDGEVEVWYTYYPGFSGDYYQPPESAEANITSVLYKGTEVIEIISNNDLEYLEEKALQDNDKYINYLDEQAEMHYEQMKLEQYNH